MTVFVHVLSTCVGLCLTWQDTARVAKLSRQGDDARLVVTDSTGHVHVDVERNAASA